MIVIAGMHRSGTSLLSRILYEAGCDFGNPNDFYPADEWNPTGYYEQVEIISTNIFLINNIFGRLSYLFLPSPKTILKRAKTIEPKIISLSKKYHRKVVKENRFCLTLDAWRHLGAEIEKVIICVRSPNDVAFSLRRRNKIPAFLALYLWKHHIEKLLQYTVDLPRHVVSYEAILDPTSRMAELNSVFAFLGLKLTEGEMAAITNGLITKSKRKLQPGEKFHKGIQEKLDIMEELRTKQKLGRNGT